MTQDLRVQVEEILQHPLGESMSLSLERPSDPANGLSFQVGFETFGNGNRCAEDLGEKGF